MILSWGTEGQSNGSGEEPTLCTRFGTEVDWKDLRGFLWLGKFIPK